MRTICNILTVLFLAAGCQPQSKSESKLDIVGGVRAHSSIAKHTAALLDRTGRFLCSTVIISKRHVLTAGHCVRSLKDEYRLYFDDSLQEKSWNIQLIRRAKVQSMFLAEKTLFAGKKISAEQLRKLSSPYNDFALLKLEKPIPPSFAPAKVVSRRKEISLGDKAIIAGYGITAKPRPGVRINELEDFTKTKTHVYADQGLLRMATVRIQSYTKTGEWLVGNDKPGKASCLGDSGGPLFLLSKSKGRTTLELLGIASRADCIQKSWYSDIRLLKNWTR